MCFFAICEEQHPCIHFFVNGYVFPPVQVDMSDTLISAELTITVLVF